MITLSRFALLVLVLCAGGRPLLGGASACLPDPQPAFAHEGSDLRPDPAIRYGRLDNGLRYALRAHPEPRGRASLRLLVEAGSIHETEAQRGLAHYLEHMAFNGSTHYPPGTLVEFFQRMGMSFGGDTNASTGFDRTLYLLELADTEQATLAEGLRIFADYAGELLLTPEEIDRERGVIISEERARDTVQFRLMVAQMRFLFGETLYPERLPIGLVSVIEAMQREDFVDFYDAWYRPELTSVIAVGDFDVDQVEALLRETFAGFAARAPARPLPDPGVVTAAEGLRTLYHHEPEAPGTLIGINTLVPHTPLPDSIARRLEPLARNVAHAMINRRFAELAKEEGAPFLSASASASDQFDLARRTSVTLNAHAANWEAALAVGEQELRRALHHGFDPAELAVVRAATLNNLEQAVRGAPTRRSRQLAEGIANDILNANVTLDPADVLALFGPALEALTVEDCLAALREAWAPAHRHVFVGGNVVLPAAEAAARIAAAYTAAAAVAVEAPPALATAAWAYTDFGPAGEVVHREHVADLDLTLVRFANGVKLNIKRTDFDAGRIFLTARVGDGQLSEPADQPGLAAFASGTFLAGGLGAHSTDDLTRLLAGRNVGVSFGVQADHLTFGGSTTADDLELQLQLLAARLTDPGYRPEAVRLAHRGMEQMYLGFRHTFNGPLALEVGPLLAGGDPRFGTPPREVLFSRTLDEVRAWLEPQLTAGDLEIGLVGDLDIEDAIAAVTRTLAALPPRAPREILPERLVVRFPAEPFAREFTIKTELSKALAVFYWPSADGIEVRQARRLSMLRAVLADRVRLRIRHELGLVYSASVGSTASNVYPDYGYFSGSMDIDPEKAAATIAAMRTLSEEIVTGGVTDDELERARLPILTGIRESVRTNNYWLNSVLARAQGQPEVMDWARHREQDFAGITREEIDTLARAFLPPDRMSHVIIQPAAP
jgi:zinc protease